MTAGKEAAVANVLILNEDSGAGKLVKSSNNRRPTMTFKTIATTSAALLLLAGTALAQTQPTAPGAAEKSGSGPSIQWTSDQEKMMYESNRDALAGFFTDDTMATLKSDAEVKQTFSALDMNTQGEIKKACDDAMSNRGSYGTVTTTLCTQVGAM